MSDPVADWLAAGDPSIAWQTQRDLLDEPERRWASTRARISEEGWGRRLLDHQDPTGTWGGGLYQPKWTSTNYTLLLLRRFGLDPAHQEAVEGAHHLLDDAEWVDGGVSYWHSHGFAEKCVNAMVLSVTSYFDIGDRRLDDIAGYLISGALDDGGWNCRDYQGNVSHSSFNTTISALEGLTEWRRRTGSREADQAIAAGHEFMLNHQMFRSHTTGEIIRESWTRFSFPPRWHYDVLRGLEHLADVRAERDSRAEGAVEVVRDRRRGDGRWPVGPKHSGEVFLELDTGNKGGRWNTLRALRVLRWWES